MLNCFRRKLLDRLLINSRIDANYWKLKSGVASQSIHDTAAAALRKLGYSGALDDMLRAFYQSLTGGKHVTDAVAAALATTDATTVKTFAGKVKGDADTSRIMKYGNASTIFLPSAFPTEVVSGYAGSSVENDASFATWGTTTPAGTICQLCCYFNLSAMGTVAANLQNFKELKVYIRVVNSTVKVFNQRTGAWENWFTTSTGTADPTTLDLTSGLSDYLGSDNTIKIGTFATTVADGVSVVSRTQIDFIKVTIKSLK